jgi:uncharacterized protein (DUF1330 family)
MMAAYLVVHVYLRDTAWVADYVANVPTIIRSYGGEYLAVSKELKQFEGEQPAPGQVAIFTFPSLDAIDKFMACDAYKPYKDARLEQSSATIIGFEA